MLSDKRAMNKTLFFLFIFFFFMNIHFSSAVIAAYFHHVSDVFQYLKDDLVWGICIFKSWIGACLQTRRYSLRFREIEVFAVMPDGWGMGMKSVGDEDDI